MTLDTACARDALGREIAAKLDLTPEMAGYAVYEMVCENMASAARVHAVERGAVIGQHVMIAFGGAAPLHAARVTEKVGIGRVVVPPNAGVGSTVGFLAAPISYEIVRSRHALMDAKFDGAAVSGLFAEMAEAAHALVAPGARSAALVERRSAFMRYIGQGHEIAVLLPNRVLGAGEVPELRRLFEEGYAAQFSRVIPGAAIEVMNWSVLVSTEETAPPVAETAAAASSPVADGRRTIFDGRTERTVDIPVCRRGAMAAGATISGPALIVEDETTTCITASFEAHVDTLGCIVMNRKAA